MPDNYALFSINDLVGNAPVVRIDDIYLLLEATGKFPLEQKGYLQSPINDNICPAIDVCLFGSLMHIFLVGFGCQLSKQFCHSTI